MLYLSSVISPLIRPGFWAPRPSASLLTGLAAFSSTRPAAITRAARESESEEARARRLENTRKWQKAARAKETDEVRQERLARRREKYASSPEFRKKCVEYYMDNRARLIEIFKERWLERRNEQIPRFRQLRAESLKIRRAATLAALVRNNKRWIKEKWSWPTHEPVRTQERVEHYCTNCDQSRQLKVWWKEKDLGQVPQTESSQDRYMCNSCFASRWDLVVPEGNIERLPPLFTSPDHPPPSKHTDTNRAHQHADTTMREETEKKG